MQQALAFTILWKERKKKFQIIFLLFLARKRFVRMKPVIVVHGGAGRIFKEREEGSRSGVTRAALKGYSILKRGGSALDAVEEAVAVMEDDPHFNAGNCCALSFFGE